MLLLLKATVELPLAPTGIDPGFVLSYSEHPSLSLKSKEDVNYWPGPELIERRNCSGQMCMHIRIVCRHWSHELGSTV